jgi:hypothetical protein
MFDNSAQCQRNFRIFMRNGASIPPETYSVNRKSKIHVMSKL